MAAVDVNLARMELVLDSAAELLVRWGFQRVTIDEVAKHAGIGKGTVYLHFRTKEALFLTVLLRAHRNLVATMAQRMDDDPGEALPSHLLRSLYLILSADPISRTLYLADPEVLGRLSHEAVGTMQELSARRLEVLGRQLELLRAAGCIRTDLTIDAQVHVMGAVTSGFYFIDAQPLEPDPAARADLLRHVIASSLEHPGAVPPQVAAEIAELYRSLTVHIDNEWQRRIR